jgi:hypothetical protein
MLNLNTGSETNPGKLSNKVVERKLHLKNVAHILQIYEICTQLIMETKKPYGLS